MRTTFLSIGRVLYDKGYKELIEASKTIQQSHKDVEFQWLGPIDESYPEFVPENQIMTDQSNGWIHYLGFSSDVRTYIKQADCIILPSYHEGMSRTLMEALALGKPIITTDIPGCRETVDEGKNGFLCKPRDSYSLQQAILKFLKLPSESINEMSQYSRRKAESQFDVKKVIRIYEEILAKEKTLAIKRQ